MEISLAMDLHMLIYLLNKTVSMLTQEESGQLEGFTEYLNIKLNICNYCIYCKNLQKVMTEWVI